MFDVDATIVALATARAEAIRGIVRMAGPRTVEILSTVLCQANELNFDGSGSPRLISGNFSNGDALGEVPCDIYLWPGARSYTRQPCAEIHTLGSAPVLDAMLALLCRQGARLAAPGEFTMRAFLAGRLDLTQAEAVLGVIEATTKTELHVALTQLAGGLATPLRALRDQLLDLLAHLEAGLDFVEEDIEFISQAELQGQLQRAHELVRELLRRIGARSESESVARVVLRGLPNVGKSSLFNALVGSDRSMVSPVSATTRDFLSSRLWIAGHPIELFDTAGVESDVTSGSISAAAQRMAVDQWDCATVQLLCIDSTRHITSWEKDELDRVSPATRLVVLTKCDQPRGTDLTTPSIATSSTDRSGLETLRQAIADSLDATANPESTVVHCTAVRCLESLRRASESLQRASELVQTSCGEELVAAELRVALDELGSVVGAVYTDDILDRVFGRFCIGK